jgi:hypothetical protein
VWRNYLPQANYPSGIVRGIYDGNNGKDTAVLKIDQETKEESLLRKLTGKSISTLYINRKYGQDNLWYNTAASHEDHIKVGPNSTSVNEYVDGHEFTVGDFVIDPVTQFAYGKLNGPLGTGEFDHANGLRRGIYYGGDNGEHLSPFGIGGDLPNRRLDGTNAPNRPDGKIEGDFMDVYQEGDTSVTPYYWGLPMLNDFLKVKKAGFPGVVPGAAGIWAE